MKLLLTETSIMNRIRIQFTISTLLTIICIGIVVFYNWRMSINETIYKLQEESSKNIEFAVEYYIQKPMSINRISQSLIENNLIQINDKLERQKFFPNILLAADTNIYSVSYGTETGEYFGARRVAENKIQYILVDASTQGYSQYFNLDDKLEIQKLSFTLGKFDPRSRDWYQKAKLKKMATFSNVYKHFVLEDLALTAAYPVYSYDGQLQGVFGAHIALSKISEYLEKISRDIGAIAYIVESDSDELVANSVNKVNFSKDEQGNFSRINISQILDKEIIRAYREYKEQGVQYSLLDIAGDKLHFKIMPFSYQGLNWLIITLIPESPYIKYIYSSMFYASLLTALIVLLAISIWTRSIKHSLQPVYDLMDISEKFSHGDLTQRAKICKTDEVGKLACAFNNMAEEICLLINNLESKVRERTLELEKANTELNTAKAEIETAAQLDFLTGLYNRRFMLAKLEEYVLNEKLKPNSLAVLLIDVDFFKKVNDTYGHDTGDMVLKVISQKLQETIRVGDIVARWGGEEFLILANNATSIGAEKLAERLRSEIQGTKIEYQNKAIFVTISLGIALNSFDIQNNVTLLIRRADEALYLAKSKGRNRFEMWTNTIEK